MPSVSGFFFDYSTSHPASSAPNGTLRCWGRRDGLEEHLRLDTEAVAEAHDGRKGDVPPAALDALVEVQRHLAAHGGLHLGLSSLAS